MNTEKNSTLGTIGFIVVAVLYALLAAELNIPSFWTAVVFVLLTIGFGHGEGIKTLKLLVTGIVTLLALALIAVSGWALIVLSDGVQVFADKVMLQVVASTVIAAMVVMLYDRFFKLASVEGNR